MEQMMGIRSKLRIKAIAFNDSEAEQQRADKLERWQRAYLRKHRMVRGFDVFRRAMSFAFLRGRGPIQTLYSPEGGSPHVLMDALDSYNVFPIYGKKGINWWTSERMMTRQQLYDYYDALPEDLQAVLRDSGAVKEAERRSSLHEQVRIVEYWDNQQFAWGVNDTLATAHEHGYPCVTLREIRLGDNGLDNERWSTSAFLGTVVNDLKMKTELQSKMALAVEAFFFPDVLYKHPSGEGMTKMDPYMKPGDWVEVHPDFTPQIVNKDVNHLALQEMNQVFSSNISKNTLPDRAFMPNASGATSGFHEAIELGELKDAVADIKDGMQVTFGQVLGDNAKLHELFDDGSGYQYATTYGKRRPGIEVITAEDIAGHYDFEVQVHAALPGDMLQKITQFKQAVGRDPVTGQLLIPPSAALELSELDDEIEDMSKFQREIDWDTLVNGNPDIKTLDLQYKEAEFADRIAHMRKTINKVQGQQQKREQRQVERDIMKGMNQDVILPAQIAGDPAMMQQYLGMIQQGMTPQAAVDTLTSQGGLPLGVPGQPMQPQGMPQGNPETQGLIDALFGAGTQVGQEGPNGLTGYDDMDSRALPPAMAGAQPRRVVDQPNVYLENVEDDMRRGGKPPAK
jgi:hypothetical protein